MASRCTEATSPVGSPESPGTFLEVPCSGLHSLTPGTAPRAQQQMFNTEHLPLPEGLVWEGDCG